MSPWTCNSPGRKTVVNNGVAAWGGYTGLVVLSKVERWSMIKVAKRPRHVGGTRAEAMLWSRAHIVHNIEKVLLIAAH